MRTLGLVGAILLLGCPEDPGEGVFACTTDNQCPPAWVCTSSRCYSERPDAGIPSDVPNPGATYTYVIRALTMEAETGDTTHRPGFDLDGTDGPTDCPGTDYLSLLTGDPGVDNAFLDVWDVAKDMSEYGTTPYEGWSAAYYRDGMNVLGIEVSGVHSLRDDSSVRIRVVSVTAVGTPRTNAMGLAEGGTYRITGNVYLDTESAIVGGQLVPASGGASAGMFIPFEHTGNVFGLPIERLVIAGPITATTISDGQLGGMGLAEEFGPWGSAFSIEKLINESLVRSALADLSRNDDGVCDAVSIGLTFQSVAATFED